MRRLVRIENVNVLALKRSFSQMDRIQSEIAHPRIKFLDVDLHDLDQIFVHEKYHAIIHTATEYGRNKTSSLDTIESNLVFPIKLLEIAIQNRVEVFINTDSYFNKSNFSYSHLRNYSMSKKALLSWLKNYSENIKICNMILEHIYGEDDNANKFVHFLIDSLANKQLESIPLTFGHQRRDFVYVADVVEAYIKVLEYSLKNNFRFRNFEVGTGQSVMIRELAEKIKNISSSKTNLLFGTLPYRDDEIMNSKADITDLSNIGWKASVSLDEGILRTIKSMQKN